jgi:hypothetical protein
MPWTACIHLHDGLRCTMPLRFQLQLPKKRFDYRAKAVFAPLYSGRRRKRKT